MRIITGKYKNKKILTLNSNITRPTISRVREDIFNILDNHFVYKNKIVVDLFAGSGVLGIEFLSRDVKYCYFNDKNISAYSIIKKNLKSLTDNNYSIHKLDYIIFLNYFLSLNLKMDILILDPPFDKYDFYFKTLEFVIKFNLLNNYGIIIIELQIKINLNKYFDLKKWEILKHKTYNKYRNLYIIRKAGN